MVVPTEGNDIAVFGSLFVWFQSNLSVGSVDKNLTGFLVLSLSLFLLGLGVSW